MADESLSALASTCPSARTTTPGSNFRIIAEDHIAAASLTNCANPMAPRYGLMMWMLHMEV